MANTLTFAGQTISDDHIFGGVSYLADLNTGEEFTIGNTASASISFVTDIRLPLYSKDPTNGTSTWVSDGEHDFADENNDVIITDSNDVLTFGDGRGRFYITEVTKEAGMYTITAYDAMILLETNISALSLTFPLTVSAAASAIATYIGCTVSGTVNNGTLSVSELDDDMTIRELLGYVAEASGCSVKIDGADHLCFMYYEDSGITVSASEYVSLEVADYVCAAIDNVTILNSVGAAVATAGSGTNTLYIEGNPFLEEATNTEAATILSLVEGFEYAPVVCEMFDENDIEIGTIATFGETPSLVMHIESSESGAMASSVGSDSRAEYNKSFETMLAAVSKEALDAADEASTKATKYITRIGTDGIQIHAEDDADANYVQIDGTGMDVLVGGVSVASYGSTSRIGKAANYSMQLGTSEVGFYKNSSKLGSIAISDAGGNNTIQMKSGTTTKSFLRLEDAEVNIGTGSRILSIGQDSGISDTFYVGGQLDCGQALTLDNGKINSAYTVNNPLTTTGLSANLRITDNGWINKLASSSERYKTDIADADSKIFDPHGLYNLNIRQFRYRDGYFNEEDAKADPNAYTLRVGFIAEEVYKCYPNAASIESGKIENWSERDMVPPMLKLIQEQHEEIEKLKERIDALERTCNEQH